MRKELGKYYKNVFRCKDKDCKKLYGTDLKLNQDDGFCPLCGTHSLYRLGLLRVARKNGDV